MNHPAASAADERATVLRYYELAKQQEWQSGDLPWREIPPIPDAGGSPERRARRRSLWRSVITQQLQADLLAVEMAGQLLGLAPHPEAKLYYSTMVQDEGRHVEAWLHLAEAAGGTSDHDPHLDRLADFQLNLGSIEEKVFGMQVIFERLVIPRFRVIARSARGTVLADLCSRLTVDDGIHHAAGVAYERLLLDSAPRRTRQKLAAGLNHILPVLVDHLLWRPRERARVGSAMSTRDRVRARADIEHGIRIAASLGIDVSDIDIPLG
jgi:1,2-phenylacetyl-CoA epoxidase catalytic subunit